MPKVCLTAEQKKQGRIERLSREMKAVIDGNCTRYNTSKDTVADTLGLKRKSVYARLADPANRLSVADFVLLVDALKITNDEIIGIIRKGVNGSE